MTLRDASHMLIVTYPKIFFAFHARHDSGYRAGGRYRPPADVP